jgi:hypothetical protein
MAQLSRVLAPYLLVTVLSPAARADIAPPPGYVEKCSVERQQRGGEECVLCSDSYFRAPDACQKRLQPARYEHRCQTAGASTWSEVWCRPKVAPASSAPAPMKSAPPPAVEPPPVAAPPPAVEPPPVAAPPPAVEPPKSGCGACRVGAVGVDGIWADVLGCLALAVGVWRRRH